MLGILGKRVQPFTRPFSQLHPITKVRVIADAIEIAKVDKKVVDLMQHLAQQQQQLPQGSMVAHLGPVNPNPTTFKLGRAAGILPLQFATFEGAAPGGDPASWAPSLAPGGGGGGLPGGGGGTISPRDLITLPVEEEEGLFVIEDSISLEEETAADAFDDMQVGAGVVPSRPAAGSVVEATAVPPGLITVAAAPTGIVPPVIPGVVPITLPSPGTQPTIVPGSQTVYQGIQGQTYFTVENKAAFGMDLDIEVSGRFSDFELFTTRFKKTIKGRGGMGRFRSAFALIGDDAQAFARDMKTELGRKGKATLVVDAVLRWHGNVHKVSDAVLVDVINADLI